MTANPRRRTRPAWRSLEQLFDDGATDTFAPTGPPAGQRPGGHEPRPVVIHQRAATTDPEVDWRPAGACLKPGLPPDLTFNPAHAERAKAHCARCPVWDRCLEAGLSEPGGIWGGLDPGGRDRLRDLRVRLRFGSPDAVELAMRARSVRALLGAGMTPERLSAATGLDIATIEALAATPSRIRRSRFRPADPPVEP